ncbi:hypothetical protein B0H65DRAFT_404411, partial [Neurospora tetraspora]
FKNHKRRGFGTPVGDVVEPLDISMATWSLASLGGRPFLLVSHLKPHLKGPEPGQNHLLSYIPISKYKKGMGEWEYQTNTVNLSHCSQLRFSHAYRDLLLNFDIFLSLIRAARPAPSLI